jgi:hypothetical protein
MRKLWKILLGVFSVLLITGIVLIVISNQNKSKPDPSPSSPGSGSSPGPSPSSPSGTCNSIINNCKPGFVCTNKPPYKCVPTPCSPACETGEFCYNGFCVPCTCNGLECDKQFILPCGGNAGETCGKTGDGCLKKLDMTVNDRNLISTFYPFLHKDVVNWEKCVTDIRNNINQDLELKSVFSIKDYDGGANRLIININNNSQVGFSDSKIKAGFFKICNIALNVAKTLGVFVYQYSPFKSGGGTGYICMCSYAFTLPEGKNNSTYIQGTAPVSTTYTQPAISGIFNQTNPLPDTKNALTFDKTTSIYYSAGLYSQDGSPENTCKVNTTDSNDELGTYLIGDSTLMGKLGFCMTKLGSETCGGNSGGNSDGNYFNQLIGKCICNNCVDSSSMCTTSNAPKYDASLGPNIKDDGWWPVGKHCPPTCKWSVWSPYGEVSGPDSGAEDGYGSCDPAYLACLGRGTQRKRRKLTAVNWELVDPSPGSCVMEGTDTAEIPPPPGTPQCPEAQCPVLSAPKGTDLKKHPYYLGNWIVGMNDYEQNTINDTKKRPCGVSINECGQKKQGFDPVSPGTMKGEGEACTQAGLYWLTSPFPPIAGPSGVIGEPIPYCSMCHSSGTSTGSNYDNNKVNRYAVKAYNESGSGNNISHVTRNTIWPVYCDPTWCRNDLDAPSPGNPGDGNPNIGACTTITKNAFKNMGSLPSSKSGCWAYHDCNGCSGDCNMTRCASTTCDPNTCRLNASYKGDATWFKCGPNQLNVHCKSDKDCPGSYCNNGPTCKKGECNTCWGGQTTKPGCIIVSDPNKSSPGAYKGDGTGPEPGYYTIYAGEGPGPGYQYDPTDDIQGQKKCNEFGTGLPRYPV